MSNILKERWMKLAFGSNMIHEAPNYNELTPVDRGEISPLEHLANLQIAGFDPSGQSNAPAPVNPDNGLIYEETVKNEFEKARKAYFDNSIENSVGALNPPSSDNSYDISIEMPQEGGLGFATNSNQKLKAELKLMPARFGSLRITELSVFEFTGSGFKWEWNSGVSDEEKAGSDPVLEKLSQNNNIVSWLNSVVSKIEQRLKERKFNCRTMLPLSIKQGLSVSAHEACGGTGSKGEQYGAIANIVQATMNESGQSSSEAMVIPGIEWIKLMGAHKDIILLGNNPHACSGKLFSLNNKTASHFPIIQIGEVSVRFRISRDTPSCGMRIEASPGQIQNESAGKSFNSGLELYDRLVRAMPGFEESFESAAQGREQAGQDSTVSDALELSSEEFLDRNPGHHVDTPNSDMGNAELRYSKKSPLNPTNRKPSVYKGLKRDKDGKLIGDLELSHRKRKYSITSRLLGK